jgi:hypothetical protein
MILILIMVASAWAQSSFKPIPASQLNKAERDKAARIADTEFKNWRSGKFEPLTDAFTDQMRAALTAELQRSAYQQTKALFGDYQSLVFAEAVASPDMPGTTVYRFRGTFDKTQDKPEIRVVTDSAGKVSGFWIKPWADQLQ